MSTYKKLLIFLNATEHDGHEADFQSALGKALAQIPHVIFGNTPKKPESIFSNTVGSVLFSKGVILDGLPKANGISPHSLIQYGICYSLEKRCVPVVINDNSRGMEFTTKNSILEGIAEFDCYLDFATHFRSKFEEWFDDSKPVRKVKPNKLAVHSYIVFGVDRWNNLDLYDVIFQFGVNANWKPRFVSDIGAFSKLDVLANSVSQRSFCIFVLSGNEPEKIYIGIGLAIGMGRPFLILKPESVSMPMLLSGYHGVIEYESFTDLKTKLDKYTGDFLSNKVFEWEGATYNDLLGQLEKRIDTLNPSTLDEFEGVLLNVSSAIGDISAKPYALLGEIFREKNRKVAPDDVELLKRAKEYYEKALQIQKEYQLYQNAITAIDKHVQLIELIKEKKYRSIPALINLIGGEIQKDYYLQVKAYLLDVVNKLVEKKEFVHAISLLAAMQLHDDSEGLQNLVNRVLNEAPLEIIKALQESQKYVVELEGEKTTFLKQIKEKEAKIEKLAEKLTSYTGQLDKAKQQIISLEEKFERTKKERDELSLKLKDITTQLDVGKKIVNELETKIESAKTVDKQLIVNFGKSYGWAIYRAIRSEPYVIRNGVKISAEKGLPLESGDVIYDEDGEHILELLPRDAIVIRSGNYYYDDVNVTMPQ